MLFRSQYACRFEDMAKVYTPNTETIRALHSFFTFRDLLVKMKNEALVHAKELHSVLKGNHATDYIYQHSLTQVDNLNREIKDVEKEIMDLINSEEEIKNNYERITSIKGVAFVNALALIVYTENFTCFDDPRKLACYAGVVPFQRTSGSSVKSNAKTSGFANKKLNTLLTQAARTAAIHDPILREYYITTASDELGRKTVMDLVADIPARLYPVGRLDKDSEGLLLMTNDGAFAQAVTHPSGGISKLYRVTVQPHADEDQILRLSSGVVLDDGTKTLPCAINVVSDEPGRTVMEMTLKEGKNREIRRMCE